MVKKELIPSVVDVDHWLCLDENCDVAYYTETGSMFKKEDLKVPIWFKRDANPKYACYCNEITEEQVIETVVNTGIDNMKDVIAAIKGKAKAQCKDRNPAGKCCTKAFNEAIEKGKYIRDN
ncbi:Csac_0668 family 2Fe-2S cluster-binding (seleno)protein [Methanococcoides methylutens]|uniref:Csac_0668 family 2Fe-2S cluster-binding (seleno)protein n=1 Tax=Methanococcoides methylutens TaxID=2226 RepID=UPI0040450810